MTEPSGERQNLNPEAIDEETLRKRAEDIEACYRERMAENKILVNKFFPHEESNPGEFDRTLSSATGKMTEGGDAKTGILSEAEEMALVLEEKRNWAVQQRAQELKDLQEIKSHGTKNKD